MKPRLPALPFLDLEETYSVEPPPLDFVIPGLLAGTVGGLVAPGGAGKSIFALQLAVSIASGIDTLGLGDITPGQVLYLALEDPAILIAHRLHALATQQPLEALAASTKQLKIATLAGAAFDIDSPHWRAITQELAGTARLIIVDTLRQAHSRDENNGSDMKSVLQSLHELAGPNGGVLFLHHTTKAATLSGAGDIQQASRGSSVLVDNVRCQMNLSVMSKVEAETLGVREVSRKEYVRLSFSKVNACRPLPDRWYRRGEGGLLAPVDFSSSAHDKKAIHKQPNKRGRDDA